MLDWLFMAAINAFVPSIAVWHIDSTQASKSASSGCARSGGRAEGVVVTAPCIVCGKQIPLADLQLYRHVMAHQAAILWRKEGTR